MSLTPRGLQVRERLLNRSHLSLAQKARTDGLWTPPAEFRRVTYGEILSILGSTGTIIPIGDPQEENAARTVVTSMGAINAAFTYSEAVSGFDTPPSFMGPGRIPIVTFNGTDEEADTPDANYWSRGDGLADSAFSVGMWVRLGASAAARELIGKVAASNNEWELYIAGNDQLALYLYDQSAAVNANRGIDTALTEGVWQFLVCTYDGTGGATAANGIIWYKDGVVVASTATNSVSYVAMENLAATVELAVNGITDYFPGAIAGGPLGPFFVQVAESADVIQRLYQLGRAQLGL